MGRSKDRDQGLVSSDAARGRDAGDVIAQQHGPVYGHVGIVVEQGSTVSAYGDVQPQGLVLKNDWGFRTGAVANGESGVDPAPTVRRYVGN